MNHPQREEWVPFIFEEAPTETKNRLRQHLDVCPACAAQVRAWRQSLRQLDDWPLPRPQAEPLFGLAPTLKWAMAAVVVLSLGVGGGLLSSALQTARLRAGIENSVRSSVQAELNSALVQVSEQNAKTFHDAELRLAAASSAERERLWRGFLQVLGNARSEDAKTMQAAFRELQERDDAEIVALRKDLETLASATDDEIRAARLKIYQLAADTPQ